MRSVCSAPFVETSARRAITARQVAEYENRQRNVISREVITATKHVRPVCPSVRRRLHRSASDAVQEPRKLVVVVVVVVYYR